jgi:multifunctional methyltransferase subunit TRM112
MQEISPPNLLCSLVTQLNCREGLPDTVAPELLEDEQFLMAFHHALLEVRPTSPAHNTCSLPTTAPVLCLQVGLEEGALVCPETSRKFPVNKGIPNMLLNEDEC